MAGINGLLQFDAPRMTAPPEPPDLSGVSEVTLDTETTGLDWQRGDRAVGIAVAWGDKRRYLPFGHVGGGNIDEGIVKRWARTELKGKRILGFNTRFDLHMMRMFGADLREQGCTFTDISHTGCLLDDHRSKARLKLDDFAEDYLGERKSNIGRAVHIADLPGHVVAAYAERDVDITQRLEVAMRPLIEAQDLTRVQQLEDDVLPVTVEMESQGLPLDTETLTLWAKELPEIAHRIITELHRQCGFACTPSKKDHMARLFKTAGLDYGRTPTGQPKFDAEDLDAASLQSPLVKLAQRWLKVQSLLSKTVTPFLKHAVNGVLYPSYNQMLGEDGGTISGRFSSNRPNGQQLLNASKFYRSYGWLSEYTSTKFLARALIKPGRGVWWSTDAMQIEYRVAGHYANDPKIDQWYKDDPLTDFHIKVQEMIRPLRRDITRTEAKAPGFARLYGGGAGTVAHSLGIAENEAEVLLQQYDRAFPAFGTLFKRAKHVAETRGYIRSALGRRSRFPNGKRSYKSLNALCQSTGADANKLALVAVYKERKNLGLTLRNTEHDSINGDLEGPTEPLMALMNEQRIPLRIPILWGSGTGDSWAAAK